MRAATGHPPGSEGKIEVLRRRVERGEPLWHPHDRNDWALIDNALRRRERPERDYSKLASVKG